MSVTPRKNIRFRRNEYIGRRIYFVTICTENRLQVFHDASLAATAVDLLKTVSSSMDILVHAFCVMPDHVHLLLEGKSGDSDVVRFIARWKQITGYAFRKQLPLRFWQRRFYDHVLRRSEDSECVAWYIWMNPVRKGLIKDPQGYIFSGSLTVEWPRNKPSNADWTPPWKSNKDRV